MLRLERLELLGGNPEIQDALKWVWLPWSIVIEETGVSFLDAVDLGRGLIGSFLLLRSHRNNQMC